ncbi:hypothetical protein [Pseudarthrobacter sp. NamE2]|uniref:hypothetical protein n=1 Tax=Pseudarthrobacter sp. NamE2 TaxID=2576838 RepID=UPI001F0CF9FE|nr:hypothetical protein [Pseudarthrobacter sp. NamE2]
MTKRGPATLSPWLFGRRWCGVHAATLSVGDRVLDISGAPFALTVRPYSMAVLDAATHRPDLVPDARPYVYLDHALRGVGTGACGPGVLDRYRLAPRSADFTLIFRVACHAPAV